MKSLYQFIIEAYQDNNKDLLLMDAIKINQTLIKDEPSKTIPIIREILSKSKFERNYGYSNESIKSLYDHSYDGDLCITVIQVIPQILSSGVVLSPFRQGHTIKDKTGVMCLPLIINDKRYYGVLVSGKKKNGFQYPYAIRVYKDDFIKSELMKISRASLQSNTPHQNSDFQKFTTKLLLDYILNNSDLSFLQNKEQNSDINQD